MGYVGELNSFEPGIVSKGLEELNHNKKCENVSDYFVLLVFVLIQQFIKWLESKQAVTKDSYNLKLQKYFNMYALPSTFIFCNLCKCCF